MSKCELQIVFDREDRTYRGGEEVTGTVWVRVNQDVACNGLVLERFWQTHGRGNTARGQRTSSVLFQGEWRAGESFDYPFRFFAPDGPPTYRGRCLNVDHYVRVRVDIPWAFDPKLKEEFILLPGGRQYGNLPPAPGRQRSRGSAFDARLVIGLALIFFGAVFGSIVGVLMIAGGLILGFLCLRRLLTEQRIGRVRLQCGAVQAAPGGQVPVRLLFTPRRSTRLNCITAKLVGKERCISGSGTNRSTHTHVLYERTTVLASECNVAANRAMCVDGMIPIPPTAAYSFWAKDNALLWEVEARVDIPLWPDWVEKWRVLVRPATATEPVLAQQLEPPVAEEHDGPRFGTESVIDRHGPPSQADALEPAPQDTAVEPDPVSVEQPSGSGPPLAGGTLAEIVQRIQSASRYGPEREQIVGEHAGEAFPCAVEIAGVEKTYTYGVQERFRNGRTVTGVIAGTDCKVSALFDEARNEQIDALNAGATFRADCTLLKWNSIYDRLDVQEA